MEKDQDEAIKEYVRKFYLNIGVDKLTNFYLAITNENGKKILGIYRSGQSEPLAYIEYEENEQVEIYLQDFPNQITPYEFALLWWRKKQQVMSIVS